MTNRLFPLLLTVFGIWLTSCTHYSTRVQPDDIEMTLDLQRPFVRENAVRKGLSEENRQEIIDAYFEPTNNETIGEFLGKIILSPFIIPIQISISSSLNNEPTYIFIYPATYEEQYTQQIFWGKNVLYFPQELHGKQWDLIIRMMGQYEGNTIINKIILNQKTKKIK